MARSRKACIEQGELLLSGEVQPDPHSAHQPPMEVDLSVLSLKARTRITDARPPYELFRLVRPFSVRGYDPESPSTFPERTLALRINRKEWMRLIADYNLFWVPPGKKKPRNYELRGAFWHAGMCFLEGRRRPVWLLDSALERLPEGTTLPAAWGKVEKLVEYDTRPEPKWKDWAW